jgi:uncharacterized protein (DUF58 family)
MRRLEVTFAGYWYTALTIGLGVVALISGNNVLYLIESLLLSGMIFSGVLSERTVSSVEFELRKGEAVAKAVVQDVIWLRNRSKWTLFCVEIGEWREEGFVCAVFIPRIKPMSEIQVRSKLEYSQRGIHRWNGLAVATSYPFGLARKIRVLSKPGERLVWPEDSSSKSRSSGDIVQGIGVKVGHEYSEGEVRAYTYEDDCRDIIWTLSEKGMGPLVRPRKSGQINLRAVLDLRTEPGPEFETAVLQAAQVFYRQADSEGSLIVIDEGGSRSFQGKVSSLNFLAIVNAKPRIKSA